MTNLWFLRHTTTTVTRGQQGDNICSDGPLCRMTLMMFNFTLFHSLTTRRHKRVVNTRCTDEWWNKSHKLQEKNTQHRGRGREEDCVGLNFQYSFTSKVCYQTQSCRLHSLKQTEQPKLLFFCLVVWVILTHSLTEPLLIAAVDATVRVTNAAFVFDPSRESTLGGRNHHPNIEKRSTGIPNFFFLLSLSLPFLCSNTFTGHITLIASANEVKLEKLVCRASDVYQACSGVCINCINCVCYSHVSQW